MPPRWHGPPARQNGLPLCAAEERLLLAQQTRMGVLVAAKALEAARKSLAAAGSNYTPFSPVYPKTSTGRRRALAQWITARNNPLTARVAVNHIWIRYFQRPFVETVFDFGRNGKRPSHPELLDWLAVEFMDGTNPATGWSMPADCTA